MEGSGRGDAALRSSTGRLLTQNEGAETGTGSSPCARLSAASGEGDVAVSLSAVIDKERHTCFLGNRIRKNSGLKSRDSGSGQLRIAQLNRF